MQTLQALCLEVSKQLNDQQPGYNWTRWTRDTQITYATDAMIFVGANRPDAFTKELQITLKPGVRQELPPGVSALSAVVDPLVSESDTNLLKAFNKPTCDPQLDVQGNVIYKLSSYSYDPRTPTSFFVSPAVPTGLSSPATIKINAVMDSPELTVADWLKPLPMSTNKYWNVLVAFMLSRAYEVDTESESSFRLMQIQRAEAYKMLGLKYQIDSKFNSGWALGERGQDSATRNAQ